MSWLNVLVACSTTKVVEIPVPCNVGEFPRKPAVQFFVCGEQLCLSIEDSKQLASWMGDVVRWTQDYNLLCVKEN